MTKDYGKRVWVGDTQTIAEARAKYQSDTVGQLIPFAVALYSFRADQRIADELMALRTRLVIFAQNLMVREKVDQSCAEAADVLSTHFEWMSRQRIPSEGDGVELYKLAYELCIFGLEVSKRVDPDRRSHTWSLLKLTHAKLLISGRSFEAAHNALDNVSRYAARIEDPNQRARVYRKLGLLYRKCSQYPSGFYWGIRACFVPGVPMAVQAKSAAALFGIDR